MKYILNSAVITSAGVYEYFHISPDEAKKWLKEGNVKSTIGYQETAEALSLLLGCTIEVDRITIVMEPGDEALVFRLVLPPGSERIDPKNKGQILSYVQQGHWELGILKKIK